jgi:hypothetical protein
MGELDVISRTEESGNGLFIVVKVVGSRHLLLCLLLESTPARSFSELRKTSTAPFAFSVRICSMALYRQEITDNSFSSTFTKIPRMHYDKRDTL